MIKLYKNLYLHYSTAIIVLCFLLGGNYDSLGLTLLSVILHECGHLLMLIICGEKPEKLVLHAFGISINTDSRRLSSRKMLLTALGGPALSLALAGLFYFVFPPLFPVNLCIGVVNLLPTVPLDGGRILGIFLLKILGRKSSRIIMHTTGLCLGIAAIPAGLLLFIHSGFNISLITLGFFIVAEAFNTPFSEPVCFVLKKPVLGEIYLIPQAMSLRETVEMLPSHGIGAVIDENGTVLHLVTAKGLYNHLAQSSENTNSPF